MQNFIFKIVHYLIDLMGYFEFIMLKDLFSFISGIGVGLFLACLLAGKFLLHLKSTDHMEKFMLVQFDDDDKPIYVTNPKGFMEAVYLMALFIFTPLSRKRGFRKRDLKRTKHIIIIFAVILVILLTLTFIMVFSVILPNGRIEFIG